MPADMSRTGGKRMEGRGGRSAVRQGAAEVAPRWPMAATRSTTVGKMMEGRGRRSASHEGAAERWRSGSAETRRKLSVVDDSAGGDVEVSEARAAPVARVAGAEVAG